MRVTTAAVICNGNVTGAGEGRQARPTIPGEVPERSPSPRYRSASIRRRTTVGNVHTPTIASPLGASACRGVRIPSAAGVGLQARLLEESLADVRVLFEVNFFAVASLCRQALRSMGARGRGHLINVSSAAARRGLPRLNAYAASKGAVHTFTQAIRMEARPLGVAVSEVLPVSTASCFFERAANRAGVEYRPGGPIQTPEQVAAAILRCARRPVAEVYPSRMVLPANGLEALAPNLVDRLLAWYYCKEWR